MSQNQQQAKDTAVGYLKIVVVLLNENKDELDLGMGRPLRMEDLDNLTSHQMLKIVMFLLGDVIGQKPIFKLSPLSQYNKFGLGNVSYDSGIDTIYHSVKQIFPEDSDLFHYSVLLLPAANPKRTKAVISYIMSFVIMCDKYNVYFNECFNEVMKENEEKGAIFRTIDDLKDKISEKIQEKEMEKQRLPTLQKELQTLEENIKKQQKVLGNFSASVEKLKAKYEAEQLRIQKLEQESERLDLEKLSLEQQIVLDSKELETEHVAVKKQLEAESKVRERIGEELERHAKGCDIFEGLNQRAHHVLQSIEAVVNLMENTKLKMELYTKTGNEITSASRHLEGRKQEVKKLQQRHTDKLAELNTQKEDFEFKLEELRHEIPRAQEQFVQTKENIKQEEIKLNEIRSSIEKVNQNIENFKKDIDNCTKQLEEILPQKRSEVEAEAIRSLQRIKKEFTKYPELNIPSDSTEPKKPKEK